MAPPTAADAGLDRLPPQSLEAEQSVLGAVLLDNAVLPRVIEILQPEDFYRGAHRRLYAAMLDLFERDESIDLITLRERLEQKNELAEVGGAVYLASLVDQVPTAANVAHHARIVREKAVLRGLITASTEIAALSYEGAREVDLILDEAERRIFLLSERSVRAGFAAMREVLKDSFKVIERLYEKKEHVTGVPSGFADLDQLTCGFQPSDLIIIAGRPSMGKTAFVLNVAEHVGIESRLPVAVFSLEMSREQLVMRMLSSLSGVDGNRLRRGFLSREDWPLLSRAAGKLAEAPIYIDDSAACSVLEIRAKSRRLKSDHGLGLVIIDYLQLIRGRDRVESRQQEISEISRSLKSLAKELKVPVIALSQLSRAVESRGGDRRPQLSDLRESGAIEQDADVVAFIFREDMYRDEAEYQGIAEVIVRKQRNGPTATVKLAFRRECTRFGNLAPGYTE
ncbi:MAG TPA: replicative DNA helicase [Candidatus Methanoperedens sp.]|nr:replicative DNA helicase [Candidatus Methanoperedens sp.]